MRGVRFGLGGGLVFRWWRSGSLTGCLYGAGDWGCLVVWRESWVCVGGVVLCGSSVLCVAQTRGSEGGFVVIDLIEVLEGSAGVRHIALVWCVRLRI